MTVGRWKLVSAAAAIGLGSGCVDRRFVVETNVPGAQVAVDGAALGPSPVDGRREYPGWYTFTASAPGYEPLEQRVRFRHRWYDYPPLDFVAEVLWPFRIEDVRRVRLDLEPVRPVNIGELTTRGEELRTVGQNLPPSKVPARTAPPAAGGPPASPPNVGTVPAPLPGNLFPLPPLPGPSQPGGMQDLPPTGPAAPLPGGAYPLGPSSAGGR